MGSQPSDSAPRDDGELRSFSGYARRDPERSALIDPDGETLSYGELSRRVNQLSNAVLAAVPQPGATVAMLLTNGPDALITERAVTQLPLYLTPVNWHLTAPEIAYILADSRAALLVTTAELLDTALAAALQAGLPAGQIIVTGRAATGGAAQRSTATGGAATGSARLMEDFIAGHAAGPPPGRTAGQRMLYTSGTTGRPKGVRRKLSGVSPEAAAQAVVARAHLYHADHEGGTYLSVAPLYHAAPLAYAVQSLDVGHTVVITGKWNAERALRLIARHRVTWTYLAPIMFGELLALDEGTRRGCDTSSLISVLHTAAPCPEPVKRAMIDWLGPVLNELYGGTEGGATFIDSADWLAHPGSVGRARKGVTIKILDGAGDPLPAPTPTPGTIYFSNPGTSFEYFNDPGKTAANRSGELTTLGDIGYLDDEGYLFLCDRAADVIISGGVNIYPAEIERALLEYPDVIDACVVGAPDPHWGERIFAAIVLRPGRAPHDTVAHDPAPRDPAPHDAEAVRAFLRERIAGFKVPKDIAFVDQVPRSDAGKLLRRTLREQLWRDKETRL